jgi:hypothetical protein
LPEIRRHYFLEEYCIFLRDIISTSGFSRHSPGSQALRGAQAYMSIPSSRIGCGGIEIFCLAAERLINYRTKIILSLCRA